MSRSTKLGEMKEVGLSPGTIRYRERGAGRPIVFLHGLLVNADLWRKVVPALARDYRCIAPDLPLGAHEIPMQPDADLSVHALARMIAEFLEALDLDDVVLVANDSGGALAQIVVTEHAARVGALVLTSCDAYDHFPPPMFKPLIALARTPRLLAFALGLLKRPQLGRLPFAFGWLSKRPVESPYLDSYLDPFRRDPAIRRDCCKFMRDAHPRQTHAVAKKLHRFERPVLIAWAAEDRLFPVANARRLAEDFPAARLELVEDSYTFVPEDQPERLATLIGDFAGSGARLRSAG